MYFHVFTLGGKTYLSCLCGSERTNGGVQNVTDFLNCLCGSEPRLHPESRQFTFLSCLCGSEHYAIEFEHDENGEIVGSYRVDSDGNEIESFDLNFDDEESFDLNW